MEDTKLDVPATVQEGVPTAAQQKVYDQLAQFAVVHKLGLQRVCGISTRPYPLIIGPSGSGKTHLVRRLAAETKQPLFAINAHNWIVRGAKFDTQITLDQLAEFVRSNATGIILIDEVNKLTSTHAGESSWSASVLSEIIALLDMDERLDAMGLAGLRHKLADFLVVGAAAFQDEWNNSQRAPIGFVEGATDLETEAFEQAVRDQQLVPDELLYRFNDRILVMPPPRASEFAERITSIRDALQLAVLTKTETRDLALEAERSGKMMRWLEGYAAFCTQQACPKRMFALAAPERERYRNGATAAAKADAEKARQKDYDSAYAIYGIRLEKLAQSASQTANLMKEIAWVAWESSRGAGWAAVKQVLEDVDQEAILLTPDSATMADVLDCLSRAARRVCQVSVADDDSHGLLSSEVRQYTETLCRLVSKLIGPLNRLNVGASAMEVLQDFVKSGEFLLDEHRNLEVINKADYIRLSRRGEGDPRTAWLLPLGSRH